MNSKEARGNHLANSAAKQTAGGPREVDSRVVEEDHPVLTLQTFPVDRVYLKELEETASPDKKESWKWRGATLRNGLFECNKKPCLPRSMYPAVVQWAHGAAHLTKTFMNSLINKCCTKSYSTDRQLLQIMHYLHQM